MGSEEIPTSEAHGRRLASPVEAAIRVPPWTNSAMDGYAVRFEDLVGASVENPRTLRVVADIPAGSTENPEIGPGEAARIMTGAPLPETTDTVVPQELTDGGQTRVAIQEAPSRGHHVRHAGEDRIAGDRIADTGTVVTPEVLASIASSGVGQVSVCLKPRAVVVSTGDELVAAGSKLSRGQIPDSNSLLVSALISEEGCDVESDHAGDGPGQLEHTLARYRENVDLIVITGGVSVGAFDPVKSLFEGDETVQFDRVAMQPGKPQAFGRLGKDGPLLFGLPGNPVSAWVSFQMFVRPALMKMQGASNLRPNPVEAKAAEDWNTPPGRMQVIPVRVSDGEARVVLPSAGGSGSHLIASLGDADGYALVAAEIDGIRKGDRVMTVRLRDPEQFKNQQRSDL